MDAVVSSEALEDTVCELMQSNRSALLYNSTSWRSALGDEMKVSEVLKAIKDDGWFQVAQKGSHRQFKHPSKPGRVTIAGKPSDELAKGTQMSILKQAGLRGSEQP
ncbi:type II toxin-antitoxin system HicA family toxin [Cyanobium sp. FGCU-6]|nr:type II toxin-antitoxin system HicA family toxin [Cyanobium sp. FGCU6]